jgi:L-lactate utilization protein LutB
MADTQFKHRIGDALENKTLRGTLGRFVDTYSDARDKAYEGYDVEALRDQVVKVKSYAAEHLDEMIDKFEKAATVRGAKVYRATTGEDAKQYILELAKKQNAHHIVKSKSMASEEIHLNQTLIDAGLDDKKQTSENGLFRWLDSVLPIWLCRQFI